MSTHTSILSFSGFLSPMASCLLPVPVPDPAQHWWPPVDLPTLLFTGMARSFRMHMVDHWSYALPPTPFDTRNEDLEAGSTNDMYSSLVLLQTPNRPIRSIRKLSALSPPSLAPFPHCANSGSKDAVYQLGKRVASCCCATTG